jgi:Flp pilus assembly protein TadD
VFASNGLGGAYERTFRNDQALAAYRNAVAWQSGKAIQDPTSFLNLGRLLLKLDKIEEALEFLTRAVELGPEHALIHEQLGRAHSYAGDLEAAEKEIEKAILLNPEDAHLHYVLAQLYRRLGMPDKADRELEQYQLLQKPSTHRPD